MKTLKVKLTFTEPLLGTWPAKPTVARLGSRSCMIIKSEESRERIRQADGI